MTIKRVLVTGAAGYLTRQLLPALRERYELVLLDRVRPPDIDDVVEVDLADPDIDRYRAHFRGVDAIVHNVRATRPGVDTGAPRQWLAERPPSDLDGYYVERLSLDMAYHVFRLAQEEGVRRVVTTSSNHATDWYETKLHDGRMDFVDHQTYPLADNFYGWAKIGYENLGFIFATGRFGRPVENVHLRIVVPRPVDGASLAANQVSYKRDLAGYLSERDFRQLCIKSLETPDIRNADGVPWHCFYGVSNNTRSCWSIANARAVIGYAPEDDSERVFADEIRRYLTTNGRTMG
ncbi:MAG: NAD(P)-dependent oxidoreductase [Ectothiorhodospiraceae bacterium]|nr:NAD(P)-dependent oxidoreductase [Ectothiorhodospiraceae bacterium]